MKIGRIEKHDEVEFKQNTTNAHKWGRVLSIDHKSGWMLVSPNAEGSGIYYSVHVSGVLDHRHRYGHKYT